MTDRRLTPANARVAAVHLRGRVTAPRYSSGEARLLTPPVTDLLNAPDGRRERQLLMGQAVTLYDTHKGWAFVKAMRDGYVGYLPENTLTTGAVTHQVVARSTHLYPGPDIKTHELCALSHGTQVQVLSGGARFSKTPQGHIPHAHLAPIGPYASDPVAVAELFIGTPYLWGGNSAFGIDCSGLVQAACLACGIPCPGDSDLQMADLGTPLRNGAPLERGDLLFWTGHVAWVADSETLIHANANDMAVAFEPIEHAIKRIADQGEGPVTARKRLGGRP